MTTLGKKDIKQTKCDLCVSLAVVPVVLGLGILAPINFIIEPGKECAPRRCWRIAWHTSSKFFLETWVCWMLNHCVDSRKRGRKVWIFMGLATQFSWNSQPLSGSFKGKLSDSTTVLLWRKAKTCIDWSLESVRDQQPGGSGGSGLPTPQ